MAQTKQTHFWLREETKPGEKRTPLVPLHAKEMLASGIKITVEKCATRCVPDEEYEKIGCTMVEGGSWKTAPADAYILGLKELPESNDPLSHTHIYFAHCYKNQGGWKDILKRFNAGKGTLLDLEFLNDDSGRRVAAFGRSAGFVGMGVGLKAWALQQTNPGQEMGQLKYHADGDALAKDVRDDLAAAKLICKRDPKVLVMGALGRCGRGAVDLCERAGVTNVMKWDMEETRKGGPFPEILDVDIFVNCIYLSGSIPPFLTQDMLKQKRNLSILVDVSADTSNPHNPVPVYTKSTTFFEPFEHVITGDSASGVLPFDVCSIDHLPSLVPLESSTEFSEQISKHLVQVQTTPVWSRAEDLFNNKMKAALQE